MRDAQNACQDTITFGVNEVNGMAKPGALR